MSLHSVIQGGINATQSVPGDLGTVSSPTKFNFGYDFATGVGANQADLIWSDTRTLALSATEDIDLAGVLAPAIGGGTMTFAKIKAVLIYADDANTNAVRVTRPATNGFPLFLAAGDGVDIGPNGLMLRVNPSAAGLGSVAAGTGDLITITNGGAGTPVTYTIVLLGTSA